MIDMSERKSDWVVERYNYQHQVKGIRKQLFSALQNSLVAGKYILTDEVSVFEQELGHYVGSKHALGVNSGTDSLMLALTALSIGKGDEVITVANTFHATVLAILRTGAQPVLVDCEAQTYLMDINQVEAAISPRTKAIIVVHFCGKAVDMKPLLELADRYNLYIVEDACQAIGAKWQSRHVGSIGALGCFSFHPSKNLAAAGDAGAVVTSDLSVDRLLRKLRHFGQVEQNNHQLLGFNSKLDAIQALVLHYKLPFLDEWNVQRAKIAQDYRDRLAHLPLTFQTVDDKSSHVYHLFQIRTPVRDALLGYLRDKGIDAVIRYPVPIHLQPAFSQLEYKPGDFPVAEALAKECLCLPIRPDLTMKEVDYVVHMINEYFEKCEL